MITSGGINQERQQRLNSALVIDLLRRERVCTRAKLAKLAGLKPATITNIINEFISRGLVVETGAVAGQGNRRSIGIRINGERFRIIGVSLAKRHYHVLLSGLSCEPYKIGKYPINPDMDARFVIADIKDRIEEMIAESGGFETLAIGVAAAGPYERRQGKVLYVSNLTNWDGVPVFDELQKYFSIPVFVENDANAGAFHQTWSMGSGGARANLVYVLAGQGIGSGIIADGEILHGESGLAGEIGHTVIRLGGEMCECGSRGCLEAYCSTIAIEKRLGERIRNGETTVLHEDFTWEDVRAAIRVGDACALDEYAKACEYLAVGIANIIYQLNPGTIVIGGQLAEVLPECMLETTERILRGNIRSSVLKDVKIEVDSLGENPVLLGAAALAAQEIFKDPFKYISI